LQTQVHPSAAGPNPVAQEWEFFFQIILIPNTAGTGIAKGLKFIEIKMQTRAHKSAAGPNPVAQEWEIFFK
jgi:hypothetical protein